MMLLCYLDMIIIVCLQDVVLLYYSGWCGFCTVLNHVFLRLARLFQGNSGVTVARSERFLVKHPCCFHLFFKLNKCVILWQLFC